VDIFTLVFCETRSKRRCIGIGCCERLETCGCNKVDIAAWIRGEPQLTGNRSTIYCIWSEIFGLLKFFTTIVGEGKSSASRVPNTLCQWRKGEILLDIECSSSHPTCDFKRMGRRKGDFQDRWSCYR
jgi:hypothetical protein